MNWHALRTFTWYALIALIVHGSGTQAQGPPNPTLEDLKTKLRSAQTAGWQLREGAAYPSTERTPWHRLLEAKDGYSFNFEKSGHTVKCSSGKGAAADSEETPEFELWLIPLSQTRTFSDLQKQLERIPPQVQISFPEKLGASKDFAAYIDEGCAPIDDSEKKRISASLGLSKTGAPSHK